MNDNEPNRWTDLRWQTLLILNKLRNREQIERADEREHQEQDRDNRIDRPEPAAFVAGINSPRETRDGGIRMSLSGSWPAASGGEAMTFAGYVNDVGVW